MYSMYVSVDGILSKLSPELWYQCHVSLGYAP